MEVDIIEFRVYWFHWDINLDGFTSGPKTKDIKLKQCYWSRVK